MRLTMLTTDYLPNIGGVAQHIVELAKAMRWHGHEVEVIAPETGPEWGRLAARPYREEAEVPVWRIPYCLNRSIKFVTGQISGRLSKRRFTREAAQRFNSHRPDVLHWHALDTHGWPAEFFDGPRVWTNHTSNFIEGIKTARGLRQYQREAAGAERIICPSEELADLTAGIGVPRERVRFIPNGVDSGRFHPGVDGSGWRERLGLGPGCDLVLCPRRLEKKNGVRYFIEAAIEVLRRGGRDVVFAVAGNFTGPKADSDEEVVRGMIEGSGFEGRIRLLGRVENAEIPGLYAASSLVVMPSLIEATSLSAMEAMATGRAVVSTNVGGLPFLIRDNENGLLVPPRDAGALAEGMMRLLDDKGLARRFGEAGRRRVEAELDWKAVAKQTIAVYEEARAERARGGTAVRP